MGAGPPGAPEALCPACRRIADAYPAGFVELKGPFFEGIPAEQRDEILHLVRNVEGREEAEHPLERRIALEPRGEHVLVTTTGVHLARRIGDALYDAYQGDLTLQYSASAPGIRVYWQR